MKKILSVCFAILLFALAFCTPAVADSRAVVFDGINKVSFDGRTYVPFPRSYKIEVLDENGWDYISCDFADAETKKLYDYFHIYEYEECDYAIYVDYSVRLSSVSTSLYYVEESFVDQLNALVDEGESDYGYVFESGNEQLKELPKATFSEWVQEANRMQLDEYQRGIYRQSETCTLYATDESGFFGVAVGTAYFENSYQNGNVLLVMHGEYNATSFYADGSFALEMAPEVWCYRLSNEGYRNSLNEFCHYYPDDEIYVDDIIGESSETANVTFAVLVFGVVPLALMICCAVALIKRRRTPYAAPLWVILSGSAVTIACLITVLVAIID